MRLCLDSLFETSVPEEGLSLVRDDEDGFGVWRMVRWDVCFVARQCWSIIVRQATWEWEPESRSIGRGSIVFCMCGESDSCDGVDCR